MGELLGKQIQPRAIAKLGYVAGWHDCHHLVTALAVCLAESQGYSEAVNKNPDGSTDRGIWQLNTIHSWISDEIAYDPAKATAAAFQLWQEVKGFTPWAAYDSRVYLHDTYLRRAALGVMNFLAEALVEQATSAGQTPTTRVPMISSHDLARIYP
jgi:hypothetical protein